MTDGGDTCDEGRVRCGDVCADTTTDASNCGRCGRSCEGATCVAAACEVEKVAPQETQPWGLVVEGSEVLWTNWGASGSVRRCNKAACNPTNIVEVENDPRGIAVGGGRIFWADYSAHQVWSCPLAGTCPTPTLFASQVPYPEWVVTDASHVYWTLSTNVASMQRCLHAGCGETAEQLDAGAELTASIALDATHIYWTTAAAAAGARAVWRGPKGGFAAPTKIVDSPGAPYGISVDDANVYWKAGTAVYTCPKAGPCPTPIVKVPDQGGRGTTAVHDGWLYWTVWKDPGFLRACELPACSKIVELASVPNVFSVAVDATHVYMTSFAGDLATSVGPGAILRVARP